MNLQSPEESLLLLKPTGKVPHGGGLRLRLGSAEYHLIRRWVAAGLPYSPDPENRVMAARVEPAKFISGNVSTPKTLKVFARLQNGSETEVTRFARFEAFDATIAEVDEFGAVTGRRSGDTHILAHYAGQIGYAYALVPQTLTKASAFTAETLTDPIDRLIAEKLKLLNIVPTPICDDGTFLRRVHLDIIGQLPTPNDIRAFGANPAGDKRMRVIDDLLRHPLHAAVWATKLCDITGADNRVWVRSP